MTSFREGDKVMVKLLRVVCHYHLHAYQFYFTMFLCFVVIVMSLNYTFCNLIVSKIDIFILKFNIFLIFF